LASKVVKGHSAEQRGMWLQGLTCLVDVITASASVGPALMNDFESAGGHRLLVHIISNSSPEHIMGVMLALSRLMADPHKGPEEPVAFPRVAAAVAEVLVSLLRLPQSVLATDNVDDLVKVSSSVCGVVEPPLSPLSPLSPSTSSFSKPSASSLPLGLNEANFVQNVAYSLLTLYSNQPQNCSILESAYNFLPILILTLPALDVEETVTAVLTTLSYVCQCVEPCAALPLTALCASAAVATTRALGPGGQKDRARASALLDALLGSLDGIVKARPRYAMQVIRAGLLSRVVCPPVERLCSLVHEQPGVSLDEHVLSVHCRLVSVVVGLNSVSPFAADDIRRSGLHVSVRNLIRAPQTAPAFAAQLLELSETLSRCDTSHLSESIQTVIDVLRQVRGDFKKSRVVMLSLSRILVSSDEAPVVWRKFNGLAEILETLSALEGLFLLQDDQSAVSSKEQEKSREDREAGFQFLQSALMCVSLDLSLHEADVTDREHQQRLLDFRRNFFLLAERLRLSGLWQDRKSVV
jgi:hypothetical protein